MSQSQAAHARSFQHRGRIDSHGRISAPVQLYQAGGAIQEALRLRLDADALDPTHSDSAWLTDTAANKGQSHADMVTFLGRYLTPVEARA